MVKIPTNKERGPMVLVNDSIIALNERLHQQAISDKVFSFSLLVEASMKV